MTYSDATIWFIILALGVGPYLIRLSFLGLVGDREMPDWVLRHLRYTPVAVLPGLAIHSPRIAQAASHAPLFAGLDDEQQKRLASIGVARSC